MSAIAQIEADLRAHGCKGGRGSWTCPAHEDRSPSLSVKEADDGRVLVHCFAGCETADVLAALGRTLADLFDGPRPDGWRPPAPRPLLAWDLPKPHRGRIGMPTWEDWFWGQPDDVIDAHFAALLERPRGTTAEAPADGPAANLRPPRMARAPRAPAAPRLPRFA